MQRRKLNQPHHWAAYYTTRTLILNFLFKTSLLLRDCSKQYKVAQHEYYNKIR